jgi:hypothetical protein
VPVGEVRSLGAFDPASPALPGWRWKFAFFAIFHLIVKFKIYIKRFTMVIWVSAILSVMAESSG